MALTGRRSGMFRRDDVAELSRRLCRRMPGGRAGRRRPPAGDDVVDEIVGMFRALPHDMGTSILADRGQRPAAGMGHPQRGDHPQGAACHGLATPISDVLVPLLAAASDGPG